MTKVIKKTVVTILLLCTALAFACFAACGKNTPEDPSNENRQEQQTNGENGQNGQNDQNQTFPDNDNVPDIILSADGKSVIGLKNHNLTNLVISPSYNGVTVTSIGDSAFEDCDSLISVTIPDTVIIIGENAFYDCDSLSSVTIGNNVTSIGERAFHVCSSLNKVNYTGTIDQWVQIDFYDFYSNPIYYAKNFCINGKLVTEANITTATKINDYAFSHYDSLTSVTIGDSVTNIGSYAFKYCRKLTSVTIGNSVTSVGEYAFGDCDKLVEVINKSNLNITCGLSVKTDGTSDIVNKDGYLFYTYDNVNYLLGYVGNETSLTLPENYNGKNYEIYKYAFYDCDSLTSVTIPNSVTYIGKYAFGFCSSLASVTIPDSVTSIGSYAFYYCRSLMSVTIGKGVTSIGGYYSSSYKRYIDQAFDGCDKLVEVINKSNLTITKGSEKNGGVGYYALNVKKEGESEIVNKNGYLFYTYDNVNYLLGYEGSKTSLTLPENYNGKNYEIYKYAFYSCSSLTSVTIPNSVKSIGEYAFYNCSSLTSITIGNSVTDLGRYAFYNCSSLTSVTIPDSVTSIGESAFYSCSSLMSVTIGKGVMSIGGYYSSNYNSYFNQAFGACDKLVEVINKSSLTITKGSEGNGGVGYYAFIVKTSGESEIVNKDGYLFYTYNNENYLFRYVGNETKLTLPQGFNGKNYVIGEKAFYGCKSLTSITIPNGVTSIEESAFENCSLLTNVTIGDNVKKIGERVFIYCDSLTSVIIPDSVTSIGKWAFYGCDSLMSVTIGENVTSIEDNAFYGCDKLVEVINKSNLNITKGLNTKKSGESEIVYKNGYYFYTYGVENYLMGYICNTTKLTLPDNYNGQNYSIYKSAFNGFSLLTSITIPNSVTSIGDYAFEDCSSLTSVTIGNSVTSIGDYAFEDCSSLTSIEISDSVTSIGEYAFSGCSSIEKIYYNGDINEWVENSEYIDNLMKYGKYSKELYINGELLTEANITTATKVNDSAFSGCRSLTSVTIGDNVTSIGEDAFNGCSSLTSVTIGDSVTSIGNSAFYGCSSLMSVTIGNSVTSIEYATFNGCSSLKSVTIGNSVTSIEYATFNGCSSLKSVTIGNSVTSIGKEAFSGCSSLTSIEIPDSVTYIGKSAFDDCSSLASITIGKGVTRIEGYYISYNDSYYDQAFSGCVGLVEVINKSNLTITKGSGDNGGVGYYALNVKTEGKSDIVNKNGYLFYTYDNVNYLLGYVGDKTSLTLPENYNGKNYEINKNAFDKFYSLTSIVIPNNVTSIGNSVFYNCSSLTSIMIPNSVTNIGSAAFCGCRSLTSVYYDGTAEQWSNISIGSWNSDLIDATRYYYSEIEPTGEGNYWHYDENGNIKVW